MLNSSTNALVVTPIIVFSKWPNLGYTQDYQIVYPNSPTLVAPVLFPRDTACPFIPMYPHKTYIQVIAFIWTSSSPIGSPAKHLPQNSFLMLPQSTSLSIIPDKISHHSNSSRNSFIYTATMATRTPYSRLLKVGNFLYHQTSCNSEFTMKLLLRPLDVMPLQSMEK